jgi:uncharacterized protein YbjT (DUF2867 family)
MSNKEKIILVTGATGQQGSAVAKHLLAKGFTIRAFVRDLNKPAAQALAEQGVELAQGDNEDRASLEAAMQGVYGVFSVQNSWTAGTAGETQQGINIADAAKAAGVQHLVYNSVGGAERNTGIPHFESKWKIEQHIQELGIPATIFRPVEFMDNFNWSRHPILNGTLMGQNLRPGRQKQFIAVDDVGAFVVMAFDNPRKYIGTATEIAGDALTEQEIADVLSKVIGRPVALTPMPDNMPGADNEDVQRMIRWFDESGYDANIPALHGLYPPLKTLETWLRETGWENAPVPEGEAPQWG